MNRAPRARQHTGLARRVVWVIAGLFLVVAPAFDFAWAERTLDRSHGTPCQLHANPVLPADSVSPLVTGAAALPVLLKPLERLPLFGPSIFVPPRA